MKKPSFLNSLWKGSLFKLKGTISIKMGDSLIFDVDSNPVF